MNIVSPKINKKNKSVKIFLAIFLFVFLFVSLFGVSANTAQANWVTAPHIELGKVVFEGMAKFVSFSVTLFGWATDPSKMSAVINNDSVYLGWKNVRDFLNIAFILFLLFSAFCTIFQIQKYSYKSTLLNLILMALLVNFSFPITRFIIDVSNVLAYTLISELFPSGLGSLSGSLAQVVQLGTIATPKDPGFIQIMALDIFLFIFAVTFLVMALLFIIRIIALTILIIFSPIAFTGSIIPGLQEKASSWWTQLFNYAFFAPIMIFMLYIATSITNATSVDMNTTLTSIASKNADPKDTSWLVDLCKFTVPIVILWIGMGVAKGMSIAGAGAITDFAQKAMKNTPKMFGKAAWWGAKKTGVPGGVQQAWKKRVTQPSEMAQQNREAKIAGALGDKSAAERNMKARSAQYEKDNESLEDLKAWALKGDAAAAYTLANKGKLDPTTFSTAMRLIKDAKTKESLVGKTEETRMDVTLQYKLDIDKEKRARGEKNEGWNNIADVAKHEYGELKAEDWAKQKKLNEQFVNPAIETAAKAAFAGLHKHAQTEAFKRMNGTNAKAVV